MKNRCNPLRFILIFLLCFLPFACFPHGNPEADKRRLSRETRELLAQQTEKATELLFSGLQSKDPDIKKEAVGMMRFLSPDQAYDALLSLFDSFALSVRKPEMDTIYDEALSSLYALDPEKTMEILLSQNDKVLLFFHLYDLFSIIGFDKVTKFDNIFYFTIENTLPSPRRALFYPLLWAEYYLRTKETKYRDLLTFYDYSDTLTPEQLLFLYSCLKDKKLPVKKLLVTMRQRGGISELHTLTSRSFSLDELLFQALLYRLGVTNEVYAHSVEIRDDSFSLYDDARKKYNVPSPVSKSDRTLTNYPFSGSMLMNDAAAFFYAGVPEPAHLETITTHLGYFDDKIKQKYASILLDSPDNSLKEDLLLRFLTSKDLSLRKRAASYLSSINGLKLPEDFMNIYKNEEDPFVLGELIKIITASGKDKDLTLLVDALHHKEVMVRIAAAGGILRLIKEQR
ncbi:MAG: hypothetical protein JXJ04_09510 [Spirochaetales bacterium]|nr:hypothetical protein [Spirochaetales bacterium]